MDEVGPATQGEEAARTDSRRFTVVAIVAGVCAAPFAAVHAAIASMVVPVLGVLSAEMGTSLPRWMQTLVAMGVNGSLSLTLVVIDIAIFVVLLLLARRYWIGLLFAPIAAYLALSVLLLPVLYMPIFLAIQQVQ